MTAGTAWQVTANAAIGEKTAVAVVLPKEGSTGWSDTWMIATKAKNPNCMYKWMDYIISPAANAMATEYFGEAPANPKSCALTGWFCENMHRAYARTSATIETLPSANRLADHPQSAVSGVPEPPAASQDNVR